MAQDVISALTITEKWIKSKVGLKHDNLDDVKSLSLPGSSNEKIVHLGNALQGFTRLKILDLSRNNISVLDGLEHLKLLESLILYYNAVSSLKEIYKLRHNMNIKELDIRLNPITKLEPDYRLFVIHMLPNLKVLDDRPVRDNDRKAALEHFTTDKASEFEVHKEKPKKFQERVQVPRVDLVQRFATRHQIKIRRLHCLLIYLALLQQTLGEEDVAVIDLISRGNSVWRVPGHSGTKIEKPSAEDYTKDELHSLSKVSFDESRNEVISDDPFLPTPQSHSLVSRNHSSTSTSNPATPYLSYAAYSSFTATPNRSVQTNGDARSHAQKTNKTKYEMHGEYVRDALNTQRVNGYAKDPDEPDSSSVTKPSQAYTEYIDGEVYARHSSEAGRSEYSSTAPEETPSKDYNGFKQDAERLQTKTNDFESSKLLLQNILSLVDRLGLEIDQIVKEEASILSDGNSAEDHEILRNDLEHKTKQVTEYEKIVKDKDTEIDSLRRKLQNDEEIQETLKMANNDMTLLHNKLTELQAENMDLKSKLSKIEIEGSSKDALKGRLTDLQSEVSKLDAENKCLNQQCGQQGETLTQLQELTAMLQESHRSLVVTNDHLLQEIHEEKQRHQHEVNQLHWSYEQLKKTADWLPKVSR